MLLMEFLVLVATPLVICMMMRPEALPVAANDDVVFNSQPSPVPAEDYVIFNSQGSPPAVGPPKSRAKRRVLLGQVCFLANLQLTTCPISRQKCRMERLRTERHTVPHRADARRTAAQQCLWLQFCGGRMRSATCQTPNATSIVSMSLGHWRTCQHKGRLLPIQSISSKFRLHGATEAHAGIGG